MIRSFIAVEVPQEIQAAIARSLVPLQKALPSPLIRWVPPQNVHLTLKFLGDVSPADLEKLAGALKSETGLHDPFSMAVKGLGAFPSPRRPRVIWIGLEAPAALLALQRGVDTVTAGMGFPSEDRPFTAHLTVGRVGQNITIAGLQKIRQALETTQIGDLGSVRVASVHIFKSDLRPGGPIYTQMVALPLKS